MTDKISPRSLQRMKEDGRKIVGVVAWDYQMARIVDRAGVDLVSVGDTVGINLWGQSNPFEVTMEQMLVVTRAVRLGVRRALVSADFPFGPLQEGTDSAVRAAIRFVKEAGVDMVKLDAASDFPEAVTAITRAGIPVFAQIGITPQTALRYGVEYSAIPSAADQVPVAMKDALVAEARLLEEAGAVLLNFTNSGPVVGAAVAEAVSIPVVGGFGGGPWLDGRMRMVNAAIGYAASSLDDPPDTYANVARITLDAITAYAGDVRAARQIAGGISVTPRT
ncbi:MULTISPECIES: 3-methyl-2-oxobutanoate hydroxymethyltransferase [unclassified Streptomyces]|uniref:3-methyl-2-oxobutanoate hydroxymethyltransferase n=1 Tax=unclassified Streptomyces TaxID=2593676 RepID=UPI00081F2F4C|nr:MULTISPECIES: 3-methyl-2-oxobutanoate hydroxymethyltransferase [unclassified Streptomyces]MYZ39794.1 3-methyl-2-oxobutanoate hydroxymethyltransferase [Streptomyces sp. SID4917]SCG05281.1 3-methyl-2-oxobutanoate hydroxymethyltransferase [Streptomyces sp. MnatMP-M17]